MTIVIDANVGIAVLNSRDAFHRSALRAVLHHDDVRMLNLTRSEALMRPTQMGLFREAAAEFDRLGLRTVVLDDAVADRARQLRADHGGKGFPLVDAVVVALGMELGCTVVTCAATWPAIPDASVELLAADSARIVASEAAPPVREPGSWAGRLTYGDDVASSDDDARS